MKVALAQTHILWEEKKLNFDKVVSFTRQAKEKDSDVIFFPEMSLTGFSMNIEKTAEGDSQETVENIKALCKKEKIIIGIGWTKKGPEKAENHYTVVDQNGEICSDYIKIHPFSYAGETDYFQGGSEITYFEMGGYICCTFICYDLRFPEIFQIASQKADVIVVSANWPRKREEHWRTLLRARAIENQSYILGVNCIGEIGNILYSGFTSVYAPDGRCMRELSDEEGLVLAELKQEDLDIRKEFPVKNDRKPELYIRLGQRDGERYK